MAGASKASFAAPLALCCVLTIFFLIASTIVLALIPVYLSTRNINVGNNAPTETLSAGYASDQVGARSDSIGNTNGLSGQFNTQTGLTSSQLGLNSGGFASARASSKKRQFASDATVTCERATGLSGDLFVGQFQLIYPSQCLGSCRTRFKNKVSNGLRKNYQKFTVTIQFIIVGIKVVTFQFCGFFSATGGSCTTEAVNNAYLMDSSNIIYTFNILNYNIQQVGQISCGASSNLSSIALQRNGILWAAFQSGKLYQYNVKSQVCTSTSFAANQSNFQVFSMTFLKSTSDNSETLYVSQLNSTASALGKIDTSALTLSVVGNYSALNSTAFLAATSGGSLYGAFKTKNLTIAQIQPSNAQILTQYPVNLNTSSLASSAFTIANGVFFFFATSVNGTSIYTFSTSTNSTTFVKNITQVITGATASSCLGVTSAINT